MALTIETLSEKRAKEGRAFVYQYTESAIAPGATEQIAVCVGNQPVTISLASVNAAAEQIDWQGFLATQLDEETGTDLFPIPRNGAADTKMTDKVKVIANPTVSDNGTPFFSTPIKLYGRNSFFVPSYLSERLIVGGITLKQNTCYLFALTNQDAGAIDLEFGLNMHYGE